MRTTSPALLVLLLLLLGACSQFREKEADAGVGPGSDGTPADTAPADGAQPADGAPTADGAQPADGAPTTDGAQPADGAPPVDAPVNDGTVTPNDPCRPMPLPCLDPAPAKVIEVPSEMSAQDAFDNANAGDTIQINGLSMGPGWWVPAYVTLRGCNGAKIVGGIAFSGSGGTVEGFEVSGDIMAHHTGSYVIRHNRFVTEATAGTAGVSAQSVDALVAASVTAIVEANIFEDRSWGIEARTKYDTMTHEVSIIIRNNIFSNVTDPVYINEGGLVGKIEATLQHNTYYGFDTAVSLYSVSSVTSSSGELFVQGNTAIDSNSAYEVSYDFTHNVQQDYASPPLSGTFASGDPKFVDAAGGDFRLTGGSAVIDKIPSGVQVPSEDYLGCPRPVALLGGQAMADVGAIEAQP